MRGVTITRTVAAIGLAAAIVLRGALVGSVGQESASSANRPGSEPDERRTAERLTVRVCSDCHSLEVMIAERRTPSEWRDLVEEMGTRSDGTPTELNSIRQFLTRTRGIVAVNEAPAVDFVAVLGLSNDVAERVVAYRREHGRFTVVARFSMSLASTNRAWTGTYRPSGSTRTEVRLLSRGSLVVAALKRLKVFANEYARTTQAWALASRSSRASPWSTTAS